METTTAEKTETQTRVKGNLVKVLGIEVRVGTKRHEKLIQLKNRLDDLNTHETSTLIVRQY
jgi:hypothetical protein